MKFSAKNNIQEKREGENLTLGILFVLSFDFLNSLLYVLLKYTSIKILGLSTLYVMLYANLFGLLLLSPYFLSNYKNIISGFKDNYLILITSLFLLIKTFTIQYISTNNASIISFLIPFVVSVLSWVLLKEKKQNNAMHYVLLSISMIGVLIFIGPDFVSHFFYYGLLFLYVLGRSFYIIIVRKKTNNMYVTSCYSTLAYSVNGFFLCYFIDGLSSFDLNMLIDPNVVTIGMIGVLAQFFLIEAYKITTSVTILQNFDYSRIIFTSILTYLLLGEGIGYRQIIGGLIITISLLVTKLVKNSSRKIFKFKKEFKKNQRPSKVKFFKKNKIDSETSSKSESSASLMRHNNKS